MNRTFFTALGAAVWLTVAALTGGRTTASAQPRAKAEDPAPQDKKEKLPQSGLIARTKTGAYGATQVDGPWGGVDAQGDRHAPVSGSCSKVDSFNWAVRVFNNTKDRYNVNLQMLQFDVRNRQLKSDGFFAGIAAGEKFERILPAHPEAAQCAVKLANWKMVERKKSSEELQKEIDAKKKELSDLEGQLGTEPK